MEVLSLGLISTFSAAILVLILIYYRTFRDASLISFHDFRLKSIYSLRNLYSQSRFCSRVVFTLRVFWFRYLRAIPRSFLRSPSRTVALFAILVSVFVYRSNGEMIVTATAFYASFLFFDGLLSDHPFLVITPHQLNDRRDEEQPKFWRGFYVHNLGKGDVYDLNLQFKVYDENGIPISDWKDTTRSSYFEISLIESKEPLSLERGETTDVYSIPFDRLDNIIETQPPDDAEIEEAYTVHDLEKLEPWFFIQVRASGQTDLPFLSDVYLDRVKIDGSKSH